MAPDLASEADASMAPDLFAWLSNDLRQTILHSLDVHHSLVGATVCRAWLADLRDASHWRRFCFARWPSAKALPTANWFSFYSKRTRSLRQEMEERETGVRAWLADCHLLLELERGGQPISLSLRLADGYAFGYDEDTRDGTPGLYEHKLFIEWPAPSLGFKLADGCAATYVKTCHLWRASTEQLLLLASGTAKRGIGFVPCPRRLHSAVPPNGTIPTGAFSGTCSELLPRCTATEAGINGYGDHMDCRSNVVMRYQVAKNGRHSEDHLFDLTMTLDVDFVKSSEDEDTHEEEQILRETPVISIYFHQSHMEHVRPPPEPQSYAGLMELSISEWPRALSMLEWV